ncbi:hypothetical protein [Paenibacillus sp. BC26]|uniref:hypothetical protein n=1 Tax=Paenibacillus sp. BC26 TaxID=1881032 RepID=UPI0008E56DCD|nr:hypothetical protein [Paenibacillus sp. BC26]SFS51670.1 hypothetical protein SAMN05428962_0546 [Paenibacillus sp. BC26]
MVSQARDLATLRYGSGEPLPERRLLQAGPLTAVLEEGGLRYIRYGEQEVVRGIYAAVRDRNWGTIKPVFREFRVVTDRIDEFEVRFVAEHRQGEIDFAWEGAITGSEDGTIRFTFDGEARSNFLRNRIGFCILHPSDLAGCKVEVETEDGTGSRIIAGVFPDRISPHQPFLGMTAIRHELAPKLVAELQFSGDLFEMEDQRNWTDASYKTYCTPLSIPYPVEVVSGERVQQSVTLRLIGDRADEIGGNLVEGSKQNSAEISDVQAIRVELRDHEVGQVPGIGLGMTPGRPLAMSEIEALRPLALSFLRAVIRLADPGWERELVNTAAAASALGAGVELEVIVPGEWEGQSPINGQRLLKVLVQAIAQVGAAVDTVFVFPEAGFVSQHELSDELMKMRDSAGLSFRVGGGTRAYFTELNRAELPLAPMEAAMYTINPQVHAFDIASLAETVSAQADTVRSARSIVPDVPLSIGPITFKPRLNPNTTSEEGRRRSEDRTNHTDARQWSLFGAAWTLGSLRSLSEAGAERVCYLETAGPLGVMCDGGEEKYPLYHVLAASAKLQGEEVLDCTVADRLSCDALAVRASDGAVTLLAANYTNETIRVRVESAVTLQPTELLALDERAVRPLAPVVYPAPVVQDDGSLELELLPFAVVVVR